jgi:hypothetical protein
MLRYPAPAALPQAAAPLLTVIVTVLTDEQPTRDPGAHGSYLYDLFNHLRVNVTHASSTSRAICIAVQQQLGCLCCQHLLLLLLLLLLGKLVLIGLWQ